MIILRKFNSLKSQIKKSDLVKHAGVYTASNILEKGIPFLLLPLMTRLLSKDDVGYYTLYQAVLALFIPIFTLSIDSSIVLSFYKSELQKFKIYFSNGIILFFIVFPIFLALLYLLRFQLEGLVEFPIIWLFIISLIVGVQFFTALRKSLWQVNKKPLSYGYFSILMALLKNGLGIIIILISDLGWKGIIVGHLIGLLLFAGYSFFTFFKEKLLVFKIQKQDLKDMLKVGTPLSLHRFGAWLGDSLNRIVINSLIGVAATGSYGIAATFGIFVTICQDAFNKAYVPYLFNLLKSFSEEIRINLVNSTTKYYLILLTFGAFVSLLGYFSIGLIFGQDYLENRNLIAPLVFASVLNGLYKIHTNYIFYTKRTSIIMFITLFTGILNLVLVYFFVNEFGIIGAAYASLLTQFFSYIITFYISDKLIPVFMLKK